MDHARDILVTAGLGGLTMRKVAARVGFTETAAYRYFPSKQHLLEALVDGIRDELLDEVRRLAALDVPPAERVERMIGFHVDFVIRQEGLPVLLMFEAAATGDRRLLARLRRIVASYLEILGGVIAGMGTGRSTIPERDLAMVLLGIPTGIAIRRRLATEGEDRGTLDDRVIPFVVRAFAQAM